MNMKICPMKCGKFPMNCDEERCAWWMDFAKECAVSCMCGILADSSICQNYWNEQEGDKNATN